MLNEAELQELIARLRKEHSALHLSSREGDEVKVAEDEVLADEENGRFGFIEARDKFNIEQIEAISSHFNIDLDRFRLLPIKDADLLCNIFFFEAGGKERSLVFPLPWELIAEVEAMDRKIAEAGGIVKYLEKREEEKREKMLGKQKPPILGSSGGRYSF